MKPEPLTAGFVPLLDCAPLVVAAELGFAADEGLTLRLVRESSWATIRDRLIVGHFDAAHMLGPMVLASTLGIGHLRVPMVAPLGPGTGANTVSVALPIWREMQEHGAVPGGSAVALGSALARTLASRAGRGLEPPAFGMVYPFSVHNYALRYWLAACGMDPERDVRLIVIPPPLMACALREGQIDGCCVGEPWNSLAVNDGTACILMSTQAIWRAAPDKVLGLRADRARAEPERLTALLRAVYRATQWCADPRHHAELACLLAEPRFVGAPWRTLQGALAARLRLEPHGVPVEIPGLCRLDAASCMPTEEHALWIYSQMVRWNQTAFAAVDSAAAASSFRGDLAQAALLPLGIASAGSEPERTALDFFDARAFDPRHVRTYIESFAPL